MSKTVNLHLSHHLKANFSINLHIPLDHHPQRINQHSNLSHYYHQEKNHRKMQPNRSSPQSNRRI